MFVQSGVPGLDEIFEAFATPKRSFQGRSLFANDRLPFGDAHDCRTIYLGGRVPGRVRSVILRGKMLSKMRPKYIEDSN